MTARFADTSYFLALLNPNDADHAAAVGLSEWRGSLITTEWIFVEVGNFLAPRRSRQVFGRFLRSMFAEARTTVIPAAHEMLEKGLELYESRPDKDWSLTDCISFIVMREHGLTEALSTDHHFEQAGFIALLK